MFNKNFGEDLDFETMLDESFNQPHQATGVKTATRLIELQPFLNKIEVLMHDVNKNKLTYVSLIKDCLINRCINSVINNNEHSFYEYAKSLLCVIFANFDDTEISNELKDPDSVKQVLSDVLLGYIDYVDDIGSKIFTMNE